MGRLPWLGRGLSPALLVAAALCFLLPFAAVSCNAAAAQTALGPALQQLGSAAGQGDATGCLHALDNRELVSYSGATVAFGGRPSTISNIAGCPSSSSSTPAATADQGDIGVQPGLLAALLLIVLGAVAGVLGAPIRNLFAGVAALVAALLVVITNFTVHSAVTTRLDSSGGSSLSGFGVGSVDAFFSVHAGAGYWLMLLLLGLALAVNAVLLAAARRSTTSAAGAGARSLPVGVPPGVPPEPAVPAPPGDPPPAP